MGYIGGSVDFIFTDTKVEEETILGAIICIFLILYNTIFLIDIIIYLIFSFNSSDDKLRELYSLHSN